MRELIKDTPLEKERMKRKKEETEIKKRKKKEEGKKPSIWRDSNSQPLNYDACALPLRYNR